MFRELGALWGIAECLEGLAAVAVDADQHDYAAQLFGSAAVLRDAGQVRLGPYNRARQTRELDALRATLAPDRFEAAWQKGQGLQVGEAIDAALTMYSR